MQAGIKVTGKVRECVCLLAMLRKRAPAARDAIELLWCAIVECDGEKSVVIHFVSENVDGGA